ncbi:MAG: MFS transporter [Candidatus Omnitrophica bacterium]|nr:MFS transporter [Candidatus Omnitrophota bacterium]
MSKYARVLKNRNFLLLWLGQIISQLGDWLGKMALIALVHERAPGSTLQLFWIIFFTIIPVFFIGPVAGVYVDRWDRRKTMYVCDFIQAALVLVIPLFLFYSKSFIPLYPVIFLIFSVGRFFVPAKYSIIPELVDKKDLVMANSLANVTGMIAAVLGLGISGLLVEWVGARSGFYIDSLSFLVSGVLIFCITSAAKRRVGFTTVGRQIVDMIKKSVIQEIREGVLYVVRNRDIRLTAGIVFILSSALGAVYVVWIVFIQNTLDSVTRDLGLLGMCLGLGLFLGSLLYGKFGQKVSQYRAIFISLVASGITLMIFAVTVRHYPGFQTAAGLAVMLGFVIAPIVISCNTIVHHSSDGGMMGKVFSSLEAIMHFGFLIFMFISGALADKYTPYAILVVSGAVVAVTGLISLVCHYTLPGLNGMLKGTRKA